MPTYTSAIAEAIATAGTILSVGNNASPETMTPIVNVDGVDLPVIGEKVDVTNLGDSWRRRIITLLDMGNITFNVFWVMEEPSHRNSAGAGNVAAGLRYMLVNRLKRDWQLTYPDGNSSTDAWPAYVAGFRITGKVGGVFIAALELANSGAPSLV